MLGIVGCQNEQIKRFWVFLRNILGDIVCVLTELKMSGIEFDRKYEELLLKYGK